MSEYENTNKRIEKGFAETWAKDAKQTKNVLFVISGTIIILVGIVILIISK